MISDRCSTCLPGTPRWATPLYHASLHPDEYTALLGGIGSEVVAHAVEDWRTGGGRTVWLAQGRVVRIVRNC
jgi:hypothetical protein